LIYILFSALNDPFAVTNFHYWPDFQQMLKCSTGVKKTVTPLFLIDPFL